MYLNQYDTFIIEVRANYSAYSEVDWKVRDDFYKKYSMEYYSKFYDDMSKGERIQANLNKLEYLKYKAFFKGKQWLEKIEELVLD